MVGKRGPKSGYTEELGREICERLAKGESLRAICRDDHMPTEACVRKWAMEDIGGFSSHYAEARDLGLDSLADEVRDIADRTDIDAAHKRIMFDARRWYLSKLAPKRYGDKVSLEHSGSGGGPVEFIIRGD